LQQACQSHSGEESADAPGDAGRDHPSQRRPEGARHAGAHHAHPPKEEGNAADEGEQEFGAGHPWLVILDVVFDSAGHYDSTA
jgi:hypothetical protein